MNALDSGRAVITGISAIAPNGLGVRAWWDATLSGRGGLQRPTRFDPGLYPIQLAGEVRDFNPSQLVDGRLIVQTDLWTQFGLAAASMALEDARLDPRKMQAYEMSVISASSSGGNEFGQREIERLWSKGPQFVSVYQSIGWFYAASTGQLSIKYGMKGTCSSVVSEQAGGLDAVGHARRVLRNGARMALAGGTEAPLSPYALTCQLSHGLLSHRAEPSRAYVPFDTEACGYVPGEGGAMFILEDEAAARARGVERLYGEIAGYAATFDPRPGSGREPGLYRAAEQALADAGIAPKDIDVVFADAAGIPALDRIEAEALIRLFGPRGVPVTAPKTMTGRLYAGGAALDVVAALLTITDSVIPPTMGTRELAPGCDLDLVLDKPRKAPVSTALVLARGFGGFNSAVVVRRTG
ncbi:ketosynthase chain-length factor [Melittangium boletus]|uniref:Actinorhodin polyketide beta-ketoacyl synthase n=1 Tax=Melittangium boletus DSM 14713 TaxID=1294270 RepID=A0A250IF66_9BACT|nr:ketosynthase chain-length factor [Melittangium boletus]ATB29586.1 actinorhodin polyketide beta-ketoacyl synthase [Melittangium boletus DSM 14713]